MDDKLLKQFFEKCKQSNSSIAELKNLAVRVQDFEFAANVRLLQTTLFPKTKEIEAEIKKSEEVQKFLKMFAFDTKLKSAWILNEMFKTYHKNDKITSDDYVTIMTKANELFID